MQRAREIVFKARTVACGRIIRGCRGM